MKRNIIVLSFGLALWFGLLGCGVINTLVSNVAGGSKGNTVASLWSDVPPLPGAQRLSLDMPVTMQLMIQGMIKASTNNTDVNLNGFDWIAYTTPQTPQAVTAFYTDRMTAAGWASGNQMGCLGGSDTTNAMAGFCVFARGKTGEKQSILFIVPAQDDQSKQTTVFYVRMEGTVMTPPR